MPTMQETINSAVISQAEKTKFEENFNLVKNWLILNGFTEPYATWVEWECCSPKSEPFTLNIAVSMFKQANCAKKDCALSPDMYWGIKTMANFEVESPTLEILKEDQKYSSHLPLGSILEGSEVVTLLEKIKEDIAAM